MSAKPASELKPVDWGKWRLFYCRELDDSYKARRQAKESGIPLGDRYFIRYRPRANNPWFWLYLAVPFLWPLLVVGALLREHVDDPLVLGREYDSRDVYRDLEQYGYEHADYWVSAVSFDNESEAKAFVASPPACVYDEGNITTAASCDAYADHWQKYERARDIAKGVRDELHQWHKRLSAAEGGLHDIGMELELGPERTRLSVVRMELHDGIMHIFKRLDVCRPITTLMGEKFEELIAEAKRLKEKHIQKMEVA